ncbi:hypothetical protein HMPREF2734_02685 [Corynebacterium sp. HMSC055D05]|nr:hypothetical protein HMPREF2734_02685 [Corynebacterium sp. HMSC055D05]
MKKAALAVLLSGAMVAPLVAVPADAKTVPYGAGYRVDQDATNGAFDGTVIEPGRQTNLMFANPFSSPGRMMASLVADVKVRDQNEDVYQDIDLAANTTVTKSDNGNVVTLVTKQDGVTVTRTFTIDGPVTDVKTVVEGTPGQDVQISSTVWLQELEGAYTASFDEGANQFHLTPKTPGFEVNVGFSEGTYSSAAAQDWDELNAAVKTRGSGKVGESAGLQSGLWLEPLDDSGRFETSVRIGVTTQQDAADTDGDGLPDIWEEQAFTLPNGTEIDLPRLGADPQRPDVFLQLNWMPSEWESRGCADRDRFDVSTGEVLSYLTCSQLNKEMYRPKRAMLQQLEQLFDAHGVNLHLDAGPLYAPGIPPSERRGGQNRDLLPYKEYAFSTDSAKRRQQLVDWRDELLGDDRGAVWQVGVIGDRISTHPDYINTTGVGLRGESFFVAKGAGLNTDAEFNGTILHEFGHVLGLGHDGAETPEAKAYEALLKHYPAGQQERNYIPEYKSAMNYLYQFSHFNLTEGPDPTVAGKFAMDSGKHLYTPCPAHLSGTNCFVGKSVIPADWDNLTLRSSHIGKAAGIIGLPNKKPELVHEDISAYELAVLAAAEHNHEAGLSLNRDAGNGIALTHPNNALNVRVENQGFDAHTFKVEARWGNGQTAEKSIDLAGILNEENHAANLAIPLEDLSGVSGAKTPIEVTVRNQANKAVFNETFQIPVLDYTKPEAEKVLSELPTADVKPEEKKKVEQVLRPIAQAPATSTPPPTPTPKPAPKPTVTVTPRPKPAPAPVTETRGPVETKAPVDNESDGSSASGGVIAAVVLVILGALTALFGWWYKNGEQFKLPF